MVQRAVLGGYLQWEGEVRSGDGGYMPAETDAGAMLTPEQRMPAVKESGGEELEEGARLRRCLESRW